MKQIRFVLVALVVLISMTFSGCSEKGTQPASPEDPGDEYTPFVNISYTPTGLFAGDTTSVMVRSKMDAEKDVVSIKLVSGGDTLATLLDDGNMQHGDDIVGDNVYSCKFDQVQEDTTDFEFNLITCIYDSASQAETTYTSDTQALSCFQEPTGGSITYALAAQDTAASDFFRIDSLLGEEEAIESLSVYLTNNSQVDNFVEVTNAVIINFKNGLKGGVFYPEEGTRGGKRNQSITIPFSQQTRGIQPYIQMFRAKVGAQEEDTVGSNNAFIYGAYFSDWNGEGAADGDESDNLRDMLNDSECPSFNVTYLINGECTVDALRNLTQYGIVHLTTHGMVDDEGQVCFLTREEATASSVVDHLLDLLSGNIGFASMEGGSYFWVRPSFITSLAGEFPNSIIFNASCYSFTNNTMENVFEGKGAQIYLGYDNSVNCGFALARATDFYTEILTSGNTVDDAFTPGLNDGDATPAEWEMEGNEDLTLGSGIKNPSFEIFTGTGVAGWHCEGDARIISALVDQTPTDSNLMAIISTGLGYTTDAGSIEQSFCFSANALQLSIDWNMISEEWLEWVGSQYQDYIRITLETEGGTITLLNRTIDDLADEVSQTTTIFFDQGGCYLTGWRTSTFDISAYAGQSVTLRIATHDIGDSIYDSAVLIDNVTVVLAS